MPKRLPLLDISYNATTTGPVLLAEPSLFTRLSIIIYIILELNVIKQRYKALASFILDDNTIMYIYRIVFFFFIMAQALFKKNMFASYCPVSEIRIENDCQRYAQRARISSLAEVLFMHSITVTCYEVCNFDSCFLL